MYVFVKQGRDGTSNLLKLLHRRIPSRIVTREFLTANLTTYCCDITSLMQSEQVAQLWQRDRAKYVFD